MSAQPASTLHLVDERPPGPGLSDFALWLRANGCSSKTIESRLNHVAEFARANPGFPNLGPMHVSAWLGREGFAPWSRATYYGHLRSFYTYAMENDLIERDPMARMRRPKPPRGAPRPLTAEQVQLVLGAAKPTVRTWLVLGLYAGLRAHEIAKLAGPDVNARQMFIEGKGGARDLIPTHPLVWAEAQTRPADSWWFPSRVAGGHVTNMTVSTMTTQLFKANGIEGSIHRCRHTFATNLLRSGVHIRTVQELMRRASLTSTMLYTEVSAGELIEGILRL